MNNLAFFFGGNAHFTILNETTGKRFTYRVRVCKNNSGVHFVSVLTGADNDSAYSFIGTVFGSLRDFGAARFRYSFKSRVGADATSVKAFEWFFGKLLTSGLPENVKMFHENRCGRCARRLTVPQSIVSGFGPECIELVGGAV